MTDKQIIDCEYLNIDEMRTCKAFDVSYYGDIICNEEDCIILKLKQQLKSKEQKLEKIKQYIEDNEWCLLDHTYKELLQIIEGKENG